MIVKADAGILVIFRFWTSGTKDMLKPSKQESEFGNQSAKQRRAHLTSHFARGSSPIPIDLTAVVSLCQ